MKKQQSPIEESIEEFISGMQTRMQEANFKYRNDITYSIQNGKAEIEIPYYYEYLEKGVNGTKKNYGSPYSRGTKMPPLNIVREWMAENGIEVSNGREYGMQKAWQENGIKPSLRWSDLYDKLIESIKQNYINSITSDLKNI